MRPHDLANDEEPEAKAARALVALLEWLEQKGDPVSRDWFAFVPDGDDDVVPFIAGGGDCSRASAVLDGVGDQVGDRLPIRAWSQAPVRRPAVFTQFEQPDERTSSLRRWTETQS